MFYWKDFGKRKTNIIPFLIQNAVEITVKKEWKLLIIIIMKRNILQLKIFILQMIKKYFSGRKPGKECKIPYERKHDFLFILLTV